MKILLAYDGSRSADDALDELGKAGLPTEDVEALIFTVAEIWMPPPTNGNGPDEYLSGVGPDWIERHRKVKQAALNEAGSFSRHALESLQNKFPGWKVASETSSGSPARKILEKTDVFCPDLIVMGAQGKNAISRLFLGSIAGKILSEANCPVRIARLRNEAAPSAPSRIIIGFDGSPGAFAAVETVASRKWRALSEVRLVTAIDSIVPDSIGRFMTGSIVWVEEEMQAERRWLDEIAHQALRKLEAAGLKTELSLSDDNPKRILVEEARKWNADCIFVGANSYPGELESYSIGSVAAAIAERSPCSVEVVKNIQAIEYPPLFNKTAGSDL
jgi:nucleotide-binding universal stress UspA family protein